MGKMGEKKKKKKGKKKEDKKTDTNIADMKKILDISSPFPHGLLPKDHADEKKRDKRHAKPALTRGLPRIRCRLPCMT